VMNVCMTACDEDGHERGGGGWGRVSHEPVARLSPAKIAAAVAKRSRPL
jgi:hypothetical protein